MANCNICGGINTINIILNNCRICRNRMWRRIHWLEENIEYYRNESKICQNHNYERASEMYPYSRPTT